MCFEGEGVGVGVTVGYYKDRGQSVPIEQDTKQISSTDKRSGSGKIFSSLFYRVGLKYALCIFLVIYID